MACEYELTCIVILASTKIIEHVQDVMYHFQARLICINNNMHKQTCVYLLYLKSNAIYRKMVYMPKYKL